MNQSKKSEAGGGGLGSGLLARFRPCRDQFGWQGRDGHLVRLKREVIDLAQMGLVLLALGAIYQGLHPLGSPILAIALFHSLLAGAVVIVNKDRSAPTVYTWRAFLPFILLTVFWGLLLLWSQGDRGHLDRPSHQGSSLWLVVGLVPLVEEVVFRLGFGSWIRGRFPGWLGCYLSALFFAAAHSTPTLERLFSGQIGIPLGPLLLGLACEWSFSQGQRLLPCVLVHATANLSGYLLYYLDQRWLQWLQMFYI